MASNREWYDNIFKNGLRRSGGGNELAESNPLDWSRLRVLRDGKLVPAMGEVHYGPPNELQLELLRDEAKKGNLFFYGLGEEYPRHLVGNTWYSTNPAIKSEKPQLNIPEPPRAPVTYTGTLEDELKARGLSPLMVNVSSVNQIQNEDARKRFMEAQEAWNDKKTAASLEQNQYQQKLKEYEAQRDRLTKEYNAKLREWERTAKAYDDLNIDIKQAINSAAPQRSAEILRNQEVQRAADIDARPLVDWYHNEFRKSVVRSSGADDLVESDGMDWGRVRIWDGEKFARALPEGHVGVPDAKALKNLRDAAQNGNLFMYQRGDKYPSKWTGRDWSSMDKSWIDRCRPTEVKDLEKLPEKPVNRAGIEPKLEDFTSNISSARLAINRALRFTFRGTRQAYLDAQNNYVQAKEHYDNALAEYNREMEVYNEKMGHLHSDYNKRMTAYEYMLKNYMGLTEKQKAAMENDVAQRAEEIKNNKEAQVRKAEDTLVNEQKALKLLEGAYKRMEAVGPRPQEEPFLNPAVAGQQPLGQNAYEMIAPNGYDLPRDSRITPEEASMIHIALAGSSQAAMNGGLSPLSAGQYGQMLDGVLYGRPDEGDWKYIAAAYDTAKSCINGYENNDPKLLADALSAGLRNLIMVGRTRVDLTPEMAGLAKLTERILDVMDRHPQLMENCSLNKEEMSFARGMVELGYIYSNALNAKMALTRQSAGVQALSPQQVQTHAANLFINNATQSVIKNAEQVAVGMVNTMGQGTHVMNTVRAAYQNDPTLANFANNPQNRNMGDLEKQMQGLAGAVSQSNLAKPRESAQLRQQVRDQVKEHLQQNSPQAREAKRREEELDTLERQQVRYILAQEDPKYGHMSLHDPVITQSLNDLRKVRETLEARDNQQYEKLTFRKKDMETKESLKGYANREEYKNLKPDDLIEMDDSVTGKVYELTDKEVLKEVVERAKVRELLQSENAQRRRDGKSELAINDFNLGRRLNELRAAQKQLATGDKTLDLTSPEVIAKAMENREARAQRLRGPITEMLQAQDVYTRERGLQVDDNGRWPTQKVQEQDFGRALEGAKAGLKRQGTGEPFYRSEEVQKRLEELRKAREELGPEYQNVRLTDPMVIQKSYQLQGVDPAKFGIQDPNLMTEEQRTEYNERVQAVEYLRTVEGKDINIHQRDDMAVGVKIDDLKFNRKVYEDIPGAEKNLPLNDPRVLAAGIARKTCVAENKPMNYTVQDIAALGEQIKGKPEAQAKQIVEQYILNPQPQIQQQQPQVQPAPG